MTWLFLVIGAALYWLTRYNRALATAPRLRLFEYAEREWPNLAWGIAGGVGLYALYVFAAPELFKFAARKWGFEHLTFPRFDGLAAFWQYSFAALFGAGGKSFGDRLPRILGWFGAHIKLPRGMGGT